MSLRSVLRNRLVQILHQPIFNFIARHVLGEDIFDDAVSRQHFRQRARHAMQVLSANEPAQAVFARFIEFCQQYQALSHAQIQQDLWVLFETQKQHGGYFVEFGANDGVTISNTLALARYFGWRGLLIEPGAKEFAALQKSRPESACVFGVVSAQEGDVDFVYTPESPLAATMPEFVSSDLHGAVRRRNMVVQRVPSHRLTALLAREKAPQIIDFMSIDTEGSEYDILQDFDFSAYDVRLIVVEHNHTDKEKMIDDLLIGRGYQRVWPEFSGHDAWYRKAA